MSQEIAAPADQVWATIADITRMSEWSPENVGASWMPGTAGPRPGRKFVGKNRNGKRVWWTVGTIVDAEPGRVLSFRITGPVVRVAEWRYEFEPTTAGCRVIETWTDQRGRIVRVLSKALSGVTDRAAHNRVEMEQTLQRLKTTMEKPGRYDGGSTTVVAGKQISTAS